MCPFVETIRIEAGRALRLALHEARANGTRQHFWPGSPQLDLSAIVRPTAEMNGWKCRFTYDGQSVSAPTYQPYHLRLVASLRLVEAPSALDYAHKSTDRTALSALFAERGTASDVLIVRHGLLTDTSIGNVALFDGHRWLTPASPLLKGTHRAALLAEGVLTEAPLTPADLLRCSRLRIFNAMIRWGEVEIGTDRVG